MGGERGPRNTHTQYLRALPSGGGGGREVGAASGVSPAPGGSPRWLPGLRAAPRYGGEFPKPPFKTPRPFQTDYMQTGQKTHVSENVWVKIKKCGGGCANNLLENI